MTRPESLTLKRLRDAKEYLRKHQLFQDTADPPAHDLAVAIVIPVHCESEVEPIQSLLSNEPPGFSVEIIVVINAAESASSQVKSRNRRTAEELRTSFRESKCTWLNLILLEFNELPDRHAGVGLARKIGMDVAVERFCKSQNANGLIASLDSDCVVSKDYLASIAKFFAENPECPAGTIYFEHRVTGLSEDQQKAVQRYELFLRYYVQGLIDARYPAAFHTVGSCFAVRMHSYASRGGMSRRTAAEDFYFLHKLRVLGPIDTIPSCCVYPQGRLSSRTPFGTGQGVQKMLSGSVNVYPPDVFKLIQRVVGDVQHLRQLDPVDLCWPAVLQSYFDQQTVRSDLTRLRNTTASQGSFSKRFFQWFDGLRVLQLVHYVAAGYTEVRIEVAAQALLAQLGQPVVTPDVGTTSQLLHAYRVLQRVA